MSKAKQRAAREPRTVRMTLKQAIVRPTSPDAMRGRYKTDEEIERDAASDPDNPLLTDDQLETARTVYLRRKVAVSLRLDRHVVEAFRASGKGWQSRINQVLAESLKDVDASAGADPLVTLEQAVNRAFRRFRLQSPAVDATLEKPKKSSYSRVTMGKVVAERPKAGRRKS
jgi:uncharacterized protein (DUF4415 family)